MGVSNRGLTWPDHGQNQGTGRIRFRVVFAPQRLGFSRPLATLTAVGRANAPPRWRGRAWMGRVLPARSISRAALIGVATDFAWPVPYWKRAIERRGKLIWRY